MNWIGIILVLGVVGVYFYVQQVDKSGGNMEERGRVIIPTLGVTTLILTAYILFRSVSK